MTAGVLPLFLRKELRDLRRNPQVWIGFVLLPLLAMGMTVGFALAAPAMLAQATARPDDPMRLLVRSVTASPEFAGMSPEEATTRALLRTVTAIHLLIPVLLSSMSAAFSIVGEKQQRTLEPILATPISDRELLLGKLFAAMAPAVATAWGTALLSALAADAVGWPRYHALLLPDRTWLLAVLAFGPLLGTAASLATIRVSARMTDPQAAMQFGGLVVVPGFLLVIGVFGKLLMSSLTALGVACLAALALVLGLLRRNVRKFEREEILTRWK